LYAAQRLPMLLPPAHRVVVVEKNNLFHLSPLNMRLSSGEIKDSHEGERDLSKLLASKGFDWVHAEVDKIDPKGNEYTLLLGLWMEITLLSVWGLRSYQTTYLVSLNQPTI